MQEGSTTPRFVGTVHLVGAGPGDPDLLTLRAARLIMNARLIVHDGLVDPAILAMARPRTRMISVAKRRSRHTMPQAQINALLVNEALAGNDVVRLKGGDPFVFGRGGEELDALRDANIPVFVTPGVTAATGCAAAANMALTHRDYAQAVTFVTGHAKGETDPALDWSALAALQNTLVVYMGVAKAETIAANLIAHGRDSATPVAVIENGTRANQKIVKGELGRLASLIAAGGIEGPALLVIGEVAALADGETLADLIKKERLVA